MNEEQVQILAQIIASMDESVKKLEEAYAKKDIVRFEEAKRAILAMQQQIDGVIKSGP